MLIDPEGLRPNEGLFGTHKVPSDGHWLRLLSRKSSWPVLIPLWRRMQHERVRLTSKAPAHDVGRVLISQVGFFAALVPPLDQWDSAPAPGRTTAAARPLVKESLELHEELQQSIRPVRRRSSSSPLSWSCSTMLPAALNEPSASGAASWARQRLPIYLFGRRRDEGLLWLAAAC